jgi:predicted CoA-binding protein
MLRDAHPAVLETVRTAKSIHILGAGMKADRPAHQAFHDLDGRGWRLVPVHPVDAGGSILGWPVRPTLEVGIVPEIVVFFLAPDRAKAAVRELVLRYEASQMPLLWFQPGSEHEEVLEMLNDAGILHIVDDCIVRFILRHHLTAEAPTMQSPWYLQIADEDKSGCSVWSVESTQEDRQPPATALEWCGDLHDLRSSEHTVPRYIRSLQQPEESLEQLALRLA